MVESISVFRSVVLNIRPPGQVGQVSMWLLLSCTDILVTWSLLVPRLLETRWSDLLPESRHARATLQELANIADFLEKKASDTPRSRIVHLGNSFTRFYPTILSWLSKEVCGMAFTYLLG